MKWNLFRQQCKYGWLITKAIFITVLRKIKFNQTLQKYSIFLIRQLYWFGYGIFLLLLLCTLLFLLLLLIGGILSDPDELYKCGC